MATKRRHTPKPGTPEHAIHQIHTVADKFERRLKGETFSSIQSFRPSSKLIIGVAAAIAVTVGGFWLFSHFRSRRAEQADKVPGTKVPDPLKTMFAGMLVQAISTGITAWGKSRARSAASHATQTASEDQLS